MSALDFNAGQAAAEAEISLYGSWGRRFTAWLIDGVLVWFALVVITWVVPTGATTELLVVLLLFPLLVPALYFTLSHGGQSGQTLGKRMLGVAVRDQASLGRIGDPRAFGRWAITVVFWCCLLIGGVIDGLWAIGDTRRRTLHDKVVGSVVIRL